MVDKKEIDIFESGLVPKHKILNEEDKAKLLQDLNVTLRQLPRIKGDDPVVKKLGAKREDIMMIMRDSPVGGMYTYYRVVVGESKK